MLKLLPHRLPQLRPSSNALAAAVKVVPDLCLAIAKGMLCRPIAIRAVGGQGDLVVSGQADDPIPFNSHSATLRVGNVCDINVLLYLVVVKAQVGPVPCLLLELVSCVPQQVAHLLLSGALCWPPCVMLGLHCRRWWMAVALRGTEWFNTGLQFVFNKPPACTIADGNSASIHSSKCKVKLLWRLHKCGSSPRQLCRHFRLCEPSTLDTTSSLWCAICSYDAAKWKREGRTLLPAGELEFIEKFLCELGCDALYCRQVAPDWWDWPVDFWNYELDVYFQIDGHCHWYDMRGCTSSEVQRRDLRFNVQAFEKKARVVRVHSADLGNPWQIQAGLDAIAARYRIVLSPSYATQCINPEGFKIGYLTAMQQMLPHCCFDTDSYGNTLIC